MHGTLSGVHLPMRITVCQEVLCFNLITTYYSAIFRKNFITSGCDKIFDRDIQIAHIPFQC